jgi:hypothetical protein
VLTPPPELQPPEESPVAIADPPEPEPASPKKRGKTKQANLPNVTPREEPPVVDDEACVRTRREAEHARTAFDWHGVLRHTDKAQCWPSNATRKKLRVKANMELNRFEECVRLGQDSSDSEVVGWVRTCSKRLDSKAPGKAG